MQIQDEIIVKLYYIPLFNLLLDKRLFILSGTVSDRCDNHVRSFFFK